MDAATLAAELLDRLPANRTLGLRVMDARDGLGQARLPVAEGVHNVIGALHSSGVTALADAAALAAALSAAPTEPDARRLQPLGTVARIAFHRPIRGVAFAVCELDADARSALAALYAGEADGRAHFTTRTIIDGADAPCAAVGEFDWIARLAPR